VIARLGVWYLLLASALLHAQETPAWPDTYAGRVEVLALIQTLNARILSSRSSTTTLEEWCRDHQLAPDPAIVANVLRGLNRPASAEQRQRLQATAADVVKYRKVELRCGTRVLAQADNWYVASRLTAEMNRLLETTDAPFGRVIQALGPYRETFATKTLWSPLPDGWERQEIQTSSNANRSLAMPEELFEHRAVLYTREHVPFSEVDEVYRRDLLAFAPHDGATAVTPRE
jgi:hypothetical protein